METKTYHLANPGVTLTTYLLDASQEMQHLRVRPGVLLCPGGGYHMCSDREAEPIAMHFLAMGFHVFVLRYSLKENAVFPRPLQDAEEAFEFIRMNAKEWGTDPEKIAACGFSAGGHLAAALGTMGSVRPAALILGYPCITADICKSAVLAQEVPELDARVDDKTPPTFLFATASDDCVPVCSSLSFAQELHKRNIPFSLHIFPRGPHGLATADYVTNENGGFPDVAQWIPMCKEFLYGLFFSQTP